MSSNSNATGGIGILGMLFVLFVGLKLTGHITWSWWWVFVPLWGPFALVFGIIAIWIAIWSVFTLTGLLIKLSSKK